MVVVVTEKIELTEDEMKVLRQARDLLKNIYNEASEDDICDPAGCAVDNIDDLFNYCQ